MKDDLGPRPTTVPAKRRALEQAPAVWLAEWASDESLPPSQRKRAEEERERRKSKVREVKVGIVTTQAGLTPNQYKMLGPMLQRLGATEVVHPGLSSKAHMKCRSIVGDNVTAEFSKAPNDVVKQADRVLAFPATRGGDGGGWEEIKYAKHRRLPVTIVLPDGEVV